jgi:hypothetical protein
VQPFLKFFLTILLAIFRAISRFNRRVWCELNSKVSGLELDKLWYGTMTLK